MQNRFRQRAGLVTFIAHAEKSSRLYESPAGPQRPPEVCYQQQHKRIAHHNMFLVHLLFFYVSNSEFYDSGALMMEEEGVVMGGLLVGLNVIDANLCIKGEDLDSQVSAQTSVWTSFSV